ncbi:MAG: hypothetical protein IKS18_11615 [Lachnospiraceae bacterium]|nr:hypothetical protein [Lachnospiraceae bacterium]
MKILRKGLSASEQAEVNRNVREWTEKLPGVTWWDAEMNWSLRFYEDGTVEEDGILSEAGNWYIAFGSEYDEKTPVSEMSRDYIERFCDYYLHFDSPARAYEDHRYHCRIHFDPDGNLVLWDTVYTAGVDYIHEIPADAVQDPFFTQCVWGEQGDDGKVGSLWVMQDDGLGAETIGSMGGEWVYPTTFYWSYKDPYLFIDWTSLDEEGSENHYKLEIFKVTKNENSFDIRDYLEKPGSGTTHYVKAEEQDIRLDYVETEE